MRRFIKLTAMAVLLAVVAAWDARQVLQQPWRIDAPELFAINPGNNINNIFHDVENKKYIEGLRAQLYANVWLRLNGKAGAIRAGEYQLKPGLDTLEFLSLITSGRTFFHSITFIEGWTYAQALAALRAHPAVKQTLKTEVPAEVHRRLGADGAYEGSLLPETYHFARGTPEASLLRQARQAMQRVLADEWAGRADDLPYRSAEEALTMASIVEKETGKAEERAQIAGVFVRRLQKRMLLQTDPTVIYGLGAAFDGNLRRADLRRDTPYNTYTRAGLPPTPICLPGRAAIHAALHPESGDALYFVARGDGSHQFSASLAEHNQAVGQFQLLKRPKKKS